MKNFIQKLSFVILIITLMLPMPILIAMKAGPQGLQQELSPEDLKLLEEIGREVDNYVNKLPTRAELRAQGLPESEVLKAETKEKFQEEVERYSKMSEEQLLAEMEKALAEAAATAPQPAQQELPLAPVIKEEPVRSEPIIERPKVSSDKQQAALALIDGLLTSISNFLRKAQMMVELPGKIQSWTKEGKLRGWPANLGWNNLKGQIEELEIKLNKIKDRDPKTQQYKYLEDLIKDEGLYNNLMKVKDSLQRTEPKIILSPFGLEKMTSESRQATRSVLLSLHEAVSILAIPLALDRIIEKYEPTAKKIKESEEAAQKRALEESRKGRAQGGTTIGGIPMRERERAPEYKYDYDRAYKYPYEGSRATVEKSPESGKAAKSEGGAGGGKAEQPKKEEPKKEQEKREEDKIAADLKRDFDSGLYQFIDALEAHPNLMRIESHMKDGSFVDFSLLDEGIEGATDGIKKAGRAARSLKRQLSKKTLNDAQKKELKKDIKDTFKDAKSDIDRILNQITTLEKPGQAFLSSAPKNMLYTNAKYYAYFGKKNADKLPLSEIHDKKSKGQILTEDETKIDDLINRYTQKSRPNLEDLKAKIEELKKAVDSLQ